MICTACGKANVDGAAFCENCGTRLQAQPAVNSGPGPGTIPPGPGTATPGPPPATPFNYPVAPVAMHHGVSSGQMGTLIASMSMGEKVSGGGAVAAALGFFLPWISVEATRTSLNGMDLGKSSGATYFILLNVIAAGALCYLSSQAPPAKKLLYAGYLVLLGAICGPITILSLLFVSQLSSVAGFGLWLVGLGYCAIAEGGLMTIRNFSKRTY
jgi:zinc ribbon protein